MLVWIILLGFFLFGLFVLCKGELRVSARKRIVGTGARIIGGLLTAVPFLVLGVTLLAVMVFRSMGTDAETALTRGMIAGAVVLSLAAAGIAANLKRFAEPLAAGKQAGPELSGLRARPDEPDFSRLADLDRLSDQQ